MAAIDLSTLDWQLYGWRPWQWMLLQSMETGAALFADLGPCPIRVPGSVQAALREAGLLPDWHMGARSRECEWVEHRHWQLTAQTPPGLIAPGERAILEAEGLDHAGWICVDSQRVARFEGALVPHRFDLGQALGDGAAHQLSIVFECPPEEQGQIGFTSRTRHFKPRYNFSWDWTPRFVPIGVSGALRLLTGASVGIALKRLDTTLDERLTAGRVTARVALDDDATHAGNLQLILRDDGNVLAQATAKAVAGENTLQLDARVEPWWPNGHGPQRLYEVEVCLVDAQGVTLWHDARSVGFKRVAWQPCAQQAEQARPWVCEINGKAIFLQGVNWTPVRVDYLATPPEEYEQLIALYRELGCNLLRVWGGAYLETQAFYEACDRAGLLVWQDLPLSSSGIENWPPEDPEVIADLERIALTYIERRGHHVSLLMWTGGNELQGGMQGEKTGGGIPVDASHPCIAALARLFAQHDPDRRFVPTSPSGPRFYARLEEMGQGLHEHVHGPWGLAGLGDMRAWRDYFAKDDAGFRAEVGMPGAMNAELIRKYADDLPYWPPQGEYWKHTAAWWTQWELFKSQLESLDETDGLERYVALTQAQQAEALGLMVAACKERFPACGGVLLWMGHDCFPCPANNSLIDFERNPKPAYFRVREVYVG